MANAYAKRRQEESEEKITLAYLNAGWTIQFIGKKKPDIEKILNKEHKKQMTDEEMLNQIKILNAMFGGEIVGN